MRKIKLSKKERLWINFRILLERTKKKFGLKYDLEQFIPPGVYCYCYKICPFWDKKHKDKQFDGYCHFLKQGDEELGLLWDQVKECGVNNEIDLEDLLLRNKK